MRKKRFLILFILAVFFISGSFQLGGFTIDIPWYVTYGWQSNNHTFPWAEGVAVDGSGNIYTTGSSYHWDPSQFGLPTPFFTLGMYQAAFVGKWNKKGKLLWYTLLVEHSFGRGIDLDRDGNVYITGSSYSDLNSVQFGPPIIPHNGSSDGFVAKLDSSGTLLWHTFLGGSDSDNLTAIDVTSGGRIVVTGESYGSWNTGVYGSPLIDFNTPSSYGSDIAVARLNTSGDLQWYTFLGGDDYQHSSSVRFASGGDIFVTGQTLLYWPEFKYGRPLQDKIVDDQFDGILAKLSSSGTFQWYTFIGEEKTVFPMSIDYSQSGRIFLAGVKYDFPNIINTSVSSFMSDNGPGNRNGIGISKHQVYVASFSLSGEKLWAKTPFVANYSAGSSIDIGPLGDLFISGSSSDSLPSIPFSETKVDLLPVFKQTAFLLNMDQSGYKRWVHKFTNYPFTSGNSIATFNNGITYITGSNWGGIFVVSSLDSIKNGVVLPVLDPGLFLVKINHLYTVEAFVKNTGGSVEQELYEIVPGKDAVVNIFPDPGYEIDKIVDNGEEAAVSNPYIITAVNEDHLLELYFQLIQYPPDLILTGARIKDKAWIIEKEFADLTITIIEHETSPMDVKAYVVFKYKEGIWKEITRFTEAGTFTFKDKFLTPGVEEKYILKALAPDGTVIAETDILIL